jgi:squalene-hopene/tetraprenyl-beta-curcumene cyclase
MISTNSALLVETEAGASQRSIDESARQSLENAIPRLLNKQHEKGYWCGELEGDSILQSEYILLKFIIDQEKDPCLPKIANYLRQQQRPEDGAWIQYPGSRPDLSATVKSYLALKLMGDEIDAPHMRKARELILSIGGAEHCNTYSKFYLAALGQMPWDSVPSVPPEMILSPKWLFFHIDKVSAWTRTMIMPFAIVSHFRPVRRLPDAMGIQELYANPDYYEKPFIGEYNRRWFTWKNFFLVTDKLIKLWQKSRLLPFRKMALKRIEKWILAHTNSDHADGAGAIFPPMVYNQIAFRCLGYDPQSPFLTEAARQLDRFMIEEGDTIRLQPCFSPVWDTGIALYALTAAGLDSNHPAIDQACDWLIKKECRHAGDWIANIREPIEPSGWFFEFNNAFYPDVDDTAMVTMALKQAKNGKTKKTLDRAMRWILALQNEDGGWAAFDRTKHRPLLEAIPFADHNAIQDPSCPDITGRVLECLGHHGFRCDHPMVQKAIRYLQTHQETEGCWFGRWGVNYIYGTWEVLCGLKNVRVNMQEDWIQKAGQWLNKIQKEDGSFGESANSYEDPSLKGKGPSTASQTAWGAMALMAIYGTEDPAVESAIQWLIDTQTESGSWNESFFTGTGFPRVFYLRYHLYCLYFPIMAIGRFVRERRQFVI